MNKLSGDEILKMFFATKVVTHYTSELQFFWDRRYCEHLFVYLFIYSFIHSHFTECFIP